MAICQPLAERGDTPAASEAVALVSPSEEGLVVVLAVESASVSPAREVAAAVARNTSVPPRSRLRNGHGAETARKTRRGSGYKATGSRNGASGSMRLK